MSTTCYHIDDRVRYPQSCGMNVEGSTVNTQPRSTVQSTVLADNSQSHPVGCVLSTKLQSGDPWGSAKILAMHYIKTSISMPIHGGRLRRSWGLTQALVKRRGRVCNKFVKETRAAVELRLERLIQKCCCWHGKHVRLKATCLLHERTGYVVFSIFVDS